MSVTRPSIPLDPSSEERETYFDREREKLIEEISSGFEELMTHANVLNRKLEEVYGVGKEFTTVAKLWGRFSALIRDQQTEMALNPEPGVPGTGGANFGASVAGR
ncbi:DASH complex subunit Dad1-domain-containing protein [Naematelia encephala]|uniref:DASH complex subunit DAD1 n=1 Tax=Naematelia encephala TaxID=71784 RepID=A0A1Y2BL93_9TREE|nr:DASH complex subunit Dad1-domain-containing protein [Naematelia encephala]